MQHILVLSRHEDMLSFIYFIKIEVEKKKKMYLTSQLRIIYMFCDQREQVMMALN